MARMSRRATGQTIPARAARRWPCSMDGLHFEVLALSRARAVRETGGRRDKLPAILLLVRAPSSADDAFARWHSSAFRSATLRGRRRRAAVSRLGESRAQDR